MITIQALNDSAVKFIFSDNDHYLNDGEIIIPKNALALVKDESDLITFVKSATGDNYLSFHIEDTNFASYEALEAFYKENMVGTGGSVDPEQLAGLIADAEYVSSATTIVFYNLDGDEVCSIDATAFIKDGMVDNVAISGSNLVITWNTSAGKQPISIPLSSIFNPENYYDKTAIDGMLQQAYRDTSDALYLLSAATDTKLANKADTSALTQHISDSNAHFTGSQKSNYDAFEGQFYSDDAWDVTPLVVFNDFYQSDYPAAMGQFDQRITSNTNAIATKADTSAVTAAVDAVNASLSGKADTSAVTVAIDAVNASLSGKQDTLIAGTNIKTLNNESLLGSGNIDIDSPISSCTQAEYDAAEQGGTLDPDMLYIITDASAIDIDNYMTSAQTVSAITEAVSGKADSTLVNAIAGQVVTKVAISTYNAYTAATDTALSGKVDNATYTAYTANTNTALSGKADASDVYTKTEIDVMIGDIETLLQAI